MKIKLFWTLKVYFHLMYFPIVVFIGFHWKSRWIIYPSQHQKRGNLHSMERRHRKQPIDLSILSDTTPAKATIPYINIAAPVVNPVYSNHTTVSGTGEPNKKVTVEINGVSYDGNTDESGQFSVSDIPEQEAGTEISVFLSDENSYRSQSTIVTVLEGVLKFDTCSRHISFSND